MGKPRLVMLEGYGKSLESLGASVQDEEQTCVCWYMQSVRQWVQLDAEVSMCSEGAKVGVGVI